MRFDIKKVLELAEKDFETAWRETRALIKDKHIDNKYPRLKPVYGKPHPVMETIERLRQAYLRMGFEEMINPVIVDEMEIYKQFGPEAMAVLDRCFYLAGLPRPDVGLGNEKVEIIKNLGIDIDEEKKERLREVLHLYKKGAIDGDDLVFEIAKALNVSNEMGLKVLETAFPEFKDLKPESTTLTLRSHMTSGWFITLSSLIKKRKLPLKLFSIDRCFRREQREDRSHLMSYHSASCVVVGEDVSVDDGKVVAEGLLAQFGFTKFKFKPDEKKSKYYTPETQTEVYAYHPKLGEWIEVATFGVYSPIALAKYNIDVPVMNLGLGVERLAMIIYGYEDVRAMVYPQFYEYRLSDRDIAGMIRVDKVPILDEFYNFANELIDICIANKDKESPCSVEVKREFNFNGERRVIKVEIFENEPNKKLLGPSVLNEVYVYDGNIYGIPPTFEGVKEQYIPILKKAKEEGVSTNIRYIDGIIYKLVAKIEEALVSNVDEFKFRVPIVRSLSDINLKIDELALKQIMGENKVIDVRGPVFLNAKVEIK
ncbi:TPA: O-phosphoserine--tRNA ligase [Methanocaldococcus jannaschii]|uniref:O-phosphoserine--tRNA(Cys) ligase n=4 Tax=Methanocaldococcus jannaschii TaxID=2190 RepID=SEPS_METJA|nr:O-phosphoserine--tRNA ligase [Methanocaldococcus jannaschii]Q59054.2 RecName: Full=O-phosphoserine--tRNA(Cys) ligase; Short=O-phosphoserine--tRNA ligase; AltName: Full=Non-canonical O-phosphoseryl-tRNA(Cys) synthetase; AltName: Full=O-phosphoseryl-tRNA(Cys) synthetase; Short=SepRS [Methanocaldococcus jannaschii DSM 2661]HII59395.1 O-phosphoserine--tRNA ligase [Methanocaldococcus jannaschii]